MQKKHLKIAYFGGHGSGLPDFGRTWTPNGWHQVNFWGTWKLWGMTVQISYVGILVQAIVWNYSMSESSIRSTKLSVTYYCCWGNTVSWIASSSPPICLLSSIGTIDIGTLDQQRKQSNLNITWTSEECILFLSPIRIALPIIFNIFVVVSTQPFFSLCCKRFRWERMRRVLSLETGVV